MKTSTLSFLLCDEMVLRAFDAYKAMLLLITLHMSLSIAGYPHWSFIDASFYYPTPMS